MAKEKEQPATVEPAKNEAEPIKVPVLPTAGEIIASIKIAGQSLRQSERDEIIRAVALLPAAAETVKPSPYDGVSSYNFTVSFGELSMKIVAKNDRDAWAMACDSWKVYPNPRLGKVVCDGAVAAA